MSDKEARALGTGTTIHVGGKDYEVKPITLGLLQQLQREAVASYKKGVIATYTENMDVLGPSGPAILEKKLDELSGMQIDDLPKREAYATDHLPVTDKLKERLEEEFGDDNIPKYPDTKLLALLATALDQTLITVEEAEALTGKKPIKSRIPYDSWWVTASYDGMIAMIHTSLSQAQEVDREEIGKWPVTDIAEVARTVEAITAPNMGNT